MIISRSSWMELLFPHTLCKFIKNDLFIKIYFVLFIFYVKGVIKIYFIVEIVFCFIDIPFKSLNI
jgi:hypothetical protein